VLFGLVGKNSILLVDRANHLRHEGLDRTTAVEKAGESRLRPILMTSAVLIFSMLPVALKLGKGGEGRAPLGTVLVGSMATSTLLSLIYVPVAYTYFDSIGAWMGRLFRRDPKLPSYRVPVQRAVDGRHPRVDGTVPYLVKLTEAQRHEDEPLRGARVNRAPDHHHPTTDGHDDPPVNPAPSRRGRRGHTGS
jgi:AcrB/AcrD/AcrF family